MGQSTLINALLSYLASALLVVALAFPLYRVIRRRRSRAAAVASSLDQAPGPRPQAVAYAPRRLVALLRVAGYVVLLLSLITLRMFIARPRTDHTGEHFNRGRNAVWLGVEWVNQPRTRAEVEQLAAGLARQQIQDVFVFVSYLKAQPDGSLAFNASYSFAPSFVGALKQAAPQLRVQAWIGLPLTTFDLGDGAIRALIRAFCAQLVAQAGFAGIHLDPEPIANGDAHVLALLDELRLELADQVILSIATPAMYPLFPNLPWHPWIPAIVWDSQYYQAVAQRVDQLVVMAYDSAYTSATLYRQWVRFQVIHITGALHGTSVDLRFGLPTSEEETPTHHVEAESLEPALAGLIDGLNDAQSYPDLVQGVALYPHWETDEREWQLYRRLWLGQA